MNYKLEPQKPNVGYEDEAGNPICGCCGTHVVIGLDEWYELKNIFQDMYEALVQILYTKPKSPIKDCPADISSNPCICGWHDAMKIGEKALSKAEGREE